MGRTGGLQYSFNLTSLPDNLQGAKPSRHHDHMQRKELKRKIDPVGGGNSNRPIGMIDR
jgi:hypothetical protein